MSLDVSLRSKNPVICECICNTCNHKHTREEYEYYFDYNITHNLGEMADAAGIYKPLWHPEEIGIIVARQLITRLERGLEELEKRPDHFKQFNPKNDWGDYKGLVEFVKEYLQACKDNRDAIIITNG